MMFKEWDRVVVNAPNLGLINKKGTIEKLDSNTEYYTDYVLLMDDIRENGYRRACVMSKDMKLITNKEQTA